MPNEALMFEIVDGDKHYKIYDNGEIEGFGENAWIINWNFAKEIYLRAIGLLDKKYFNHPKYKEYEKSVIATQKSIEKRITDRNA